MTSQQVPNQNISISGSQVSKAQFVQARDNVQVTQQNSEGDTKEGLQVEDVLALLGELKKVVSDSAIPTTDQERAIRGIEAAEDEIQAEDSDKEVAAKNLRRATTILKDTGEAVDAGTGLWDKVEPIITKLTPWFKVAAGFFI